MNIKICATCKNLKVLEQGREFEKILDTEFTTFKCDIFNWKAKEFYLMAPLDNPMNDKTEKNCEFWEDWRECVD